MWRVRQYLNNRKYNYPLSINFIVLKISNETKVGILAAISIVLLILGYNFLIGRSILSNEHKFYALFDRVDGLSTARPVKINGYQIGQVSALTLMPNGQILAELSIQADCKIPRNTAAQIENADLMGNKVVVFQLGNSKQWAQNGDTLTARVVKTLSESVLPIQKKVEQIAIHLDSVLVSINQMMSPTFKSNMGKTMNALAETAQNTQSITHRINEVMSRQDERFNLIMHNIESITSNLKNNNEYIANTFVNLSKVSTELTNAKISETLLDANKIAAQLQQLLAKINDNKGSLGQVVNDGQLYNNLTLTTKNLNELIVDLKQNPKRYVHFSVFGKKNKK